MSEEVPDTTTPVKRTKSKPKATTKAKVEPEVVLADRARPDLPAPPEGFYTDMWRGLPCYRCTRCQFDTLNYSVAVDHWRDNHVTVRTVSIGLVGANGEPVTKTVMIDRDKGGTHGSD